MNAKVLFVDDDELLRAAVPAMLTVLGHQVKALDGGPAALTWFATGACPDLLVLDVNMPGMGGLEVLAQVRQQHPGLPVLLASGYLDQEVERALERDPHLMAISKPFTLMEIQQKLGELS